MSSTDSSSEDDGPRTRSPAPPRSPPRTPPEPRSPSPPPPQSPTPSPENERTVERKSRILSESDESLVSERGGGRERDDEEEKEQKPSFRRNIVGSDSDSAKSSRQPSPSSQSKPNTTDLFGDDVSSSDDDEEKKPKMKREDSDNESRNSLDELHGIVMNTDDLEELEDKKENIVNTEVSMSKVQTDFGDEPYLVKLPNFLSVQTHPFDPELYEEDEDDEQVKFDEEGNTKLKLRVENTLRWRKSVNEKGEEIRESNAKFVKWSDGTMSLYLGNEIFEVATMPLNSSNLPFIYAKQNGGMSAQSILNKRLTFRPHSTDSQTHRKVTLNMADRGRKSGQVKVMDDVGVNPEIARREAVRKEEDALRMHMRRTQIARNNFKPRRGMGGVGGGGYSDDEEMYRKPKGKKKDAPIIGASSDESDASDHHKKNKKSDSDSDSDEEYRKRKQQQKKTIVTSDEDSD